MFEGMGNAMTPCAHLYPQKWQLRGAVAASEQLYKGIQGRVQVPSPLLSFKPRNVQQII